MKLASVCSVVAAIAVILTFASGQRWSAASCCQNPICGWNGDPTSTPVLEGEHFDTAEDGNEDELTVQWCFPVNPIGGTVEYDPDDESDNIDGSSVVYTPSSFSIGSCSGTQAIFVEGELLQAQDGTLVTRVYIGAYPGCGQEVDKSLFVDY
jgi:hypothetical protein